MDLSRTDRPGRPIIIGFTQEVCEKLVTAGPLIPAFAVHRCPRIGVCRRLVQSSRRFQAGSCLHRRLNANPLWKAVDYALASAQSTEHSGFLSLTSFWSITWAMKLHDICGWGVPFRKVIP